jgi:hypothetical protein
MRGFFSRRSAQRIFTDPLPHPANYLVSRSPVLRAQKGLENIFTTPREAAFSPDFERQNNYLYTGV